MPRGSDRIKLEGLHFGEWEVLEYVGNRKYRCKCSCGNIKEVHGYQLTSGKSKSCGHGAKIRENIEGKHFGDWTVLEDKDNKTCLCRCSCGVEKEVSKHNLINGDSTSCGHNKRKGKDLKGLHFGEWEVLHKDNIKSRYWLCKCSCGKEKLVLDYYLTSGKSKSCGHDTTGFKNLKDQQFGDWKVIEYAGNRFWTCKCSCGNIKQVSAYNLISGQSKSCGCKSKEYSNATMLSRYGDTNPIRINNPRQLWQIKTIADDELFKAFVINKATQLNRLLLVAEIAEDLDITHDVAYRAIVRNNLYNMIDKFSSKQEREIYDTIKLLCNNKYEVLDHDKQNLKGSELDIYIPDLKLAIEYNGSYWHSSNKKDIKYHQNKTLACINQGIRLIHIFEYEWINDDTKRKIIDLLNNIINYQDNIIIHAKDCVVGKIKSDIARDFLTKYHLQGYVSSTYYYGITKKDNFGDLLGIMTFGIPRFNSKYDYELIRLCWKPGVIINGGAEKIFSKFINEIKPKSIITYSDISKFTGKVYNRLGFIADGITEPNYKWVNKKGNTFTRYQTQKSDLVAKGLGTSDQTEDEIMENLGYLKIYDSGNLRYTWSIT